MPEITVRVSVPEGEMCNSCQFAYGGNFEDQCELFGHQDMKQDSDGEWVKIPDCLAACKKAKEG